MDNPAASTAIAPSPASRWLVRLWLVLGSAFALRNIAEGARIAIGYHSPFLPSIDFQWSPNRLLLHRIDPWQVTLAGNPHHGILYSQHPTYLHFLYVLMLPFGAMSFAHARLLWLLCNIGFATASVVLATRFYRLAPREAGTAAIMFFSGISFRVGISNGQQTFLAMLFLTLALCRTSAPEPFWSGLSFFKYNFAPPLFLLVLLRRGVRGALISLIPAVAGFLMVWAWLRSPWLKLLAGPYLVARRTSAGIEDLMSVLEALAGHAHLASHLVLPLCAAISVAASAFVVWRIARPGSRYSSTAVAAIVPVLGLLTLRHLVYDNAVLLFAACYAIRQRQTLAAKVVLGCTAYFWFGKDFVGYVYPHVGDPPLAPNFIIGVMLLAALLRIERTRNVDFEMV